jgi:hypothetical protein
MYAKYADDKRNTTASCKVSDYGSRYLVIHRRREALSCPRMLRTCVGGVRHLEAEMRKLGRPRNLSASLWPQAHPQLCRSRLGDRRGFGATGSRACRTQALDQVGTQPWQILIQALTPETIQLIFGVSILAARSASHRGPSLQVLLATSSGKDPKLATHTTLLSCWPAHSNMVVASVIVLCAVQLFTHHHLMDSYGLQPRVFSHTVEHLMLWFKGFKELSL